VTFGAVGGAHFGDGQAILPETLHHTGDPGQVLVGEALAQPATELPDVYALATAKGESSRWCCTLENKSLRA